MNADIISAVPDTEGLLARRLREALMLDKDHPARAFLLERCGLRKFQSVEAAEQAMRAGKLEVGQYILVEGEPIFVDVSTVARDED